MNKKRAVIVKTGKGKEDFAKWNYVNDLVRFTSFLDRQFPDWCYMNVFDKETKQQIASFTKNNRPHSHI
jgi:hypothetical protein